MKFMAKSPIEYCIAESLFSSAAGGLQSKPKLTMAPITQREKKLFEDIKPDGIQASRDFDKKVDELRIDRVSWFRNIGTPAHI